MDKAALMEMCGQGMLYHAHSVVSGLMKIHDVLIRIHDCTYLVWGC